MASAIAAHAAIESAPTPDQLAFFEKSIRPILAEKCYDCHSAGAKKLKGNLYLDTREGARAGGDSGHAVVPGNLEESLLISAIRYHDKDMAMPPEKAGGKLPDAVIADFEKWIKMGAPDPRDSGGAAPVAKKEINFDEARKFWAFQAPKAVAPPAPKDTVWPRTDLDRFILSALEAKGLKPVADADPRTLLRRVYFDLVGLPPSPEAVSAFEQAAKADPQGALGKVVDELLASPQFGERWGRHWLDVARFGESTGKERNYLFPEAWRYRDWVVASVNADEPYDQFIREQIAGDLLPAKDDAEKRSHLVATGFLAIGTKGLGEKNREQFTMDVVDEQIDTTSRAVLGLTVACARCHDHKFDPIPTKDYYALAGIFRSTHTYYGTSFKLNQSTLLPLDGSATPAVAKAPAADPAIAQMLANNPARAKRFAELPPAKKAKALERLKERAGNNAAAPAAPVAAPEGADRAMGVLDGRVSDCPLYIRGEVDDRGATVPRGFLTILSATTPPSIPSSESGRRELAQWMTAKTNPLTARVAVNRVWLQLFGEGLVNTPDNFGANGAKPTHPELLDTLAVKFMEDGWSMKRLIREIVLSRTYQLSNAWNGDNYEADPDNALLWRASARRLDAEALRDALLAASGNLQLTPPRGSVVANVGDRQVGKGFNPERFNVTANYRSLYLPIVRDFVPDALNVFDFAEPSLVVAGRETTNVPAQALYLMNNKFVIEQAGAMAKRIIATPLDYAGRIDLAYRLALSRPPTAAERTRADAYLRSQAQGLMKAKSEAVPEASETSWSTFCQALFACAEFRYLH